MIIVFFQCTPKEKLPIFLTNTLLLHIPLLALTDRRNDRRRMNTLAARGLENLFFQLRCCVSFLVVAGNCCRCYLPTIPVVPLCLFFCCGVAGDSFGLHRSVFGWGRNSFRCYLLIYLTSCAIVSVFWLQREIVFVAQFLRKILIRFL